MPNDDFGIDLKRDQTKAINGRHAATEFGFDTIFESTPVNQNIVDNHRGDTIKFTAGAQKIHRQRHANLDPQGRRPRPDRGMGQRA